MNQAPVIDIPSELRDLSQWVLWRKLDRGGKVTKPPYQPNGQKAESDNPDTWSTFEDAVRALPKFDGLGIMLANGLCGIDIDHCIENGELSPFAKRAISLLNSYSEKSPSGTGVHILFFGELPPGRRKHTATGFETYSSGRFFTLTGDRLPGAPTTIEERTQEAAALHGEIFGEPAEERAATPPTGMDLDLDELLNLALTAKNGDRFSRLYGGHIDEYASQSEADLALCSMLAFWAGGDRSKIDQMFRGSGLMRKKWDEKHGAQTYGEITIGKAVSGQREYYQPHKERSRDNGHKPPMSEPPEMERIEPEEYSDTWKAFSIADAYEDRPPVEFIIPGLFALPSLNIVYGPPGSLKSFILADLAISAAAGGLWLPAAPWLADNGARSFPTNPVKVLWVDFDNGRRRTLDRFAALGRAHGLPEDNDRLNIYSMPRPWLDASDTVSIAGLAGRIQRTGARLVIIDNLGVVTGDTDENTGDMALVMSQFRQIAEDTGCAIVLIHHQRKSNGLSGRAGDSLRGHSSIEAALDLAIMIEREEYSETIGLRATKMRGPDVMPFSAYFTFEAKPDRPDELQTARFFGVSVDDVTSSMAIDKAIIEVLDDGNEYGKTALAKAVKELLAEVGINRIRPRIDKLAGEKSIQAIPGKRRGERIYKAK